MGNYHDAILDTVNVSDCSMTSVYVDKNALVDVEQDAEGSSAEEEDFESKTAQQANQDDEDDDDEQEEKPKPKKKKKSSGSEKKEGQAKGVKEKIEVVHTALDT